MRPTATMLTALLLCAACMRAGAQAVPPTVHACESITSDRQRLACFDRELANLESSQTKPVTPAGADANTNEQASMSTVLPGRATIQGTNTTSSAPVSLPPEQTFGLSGDEIRNLESRQAGAPQPVKLKKLIARIAGVTHSSEGRYVIRLDNGQVWRQTESRAGFVASPGQAVEISTGTLGTFWLETSPHNWTRVERVPQ